MASGPHKGRQSQKTRSQRFIAPPETTAIFAGEDLADHTSQSKAYPDNYFSESSDSSSVQAQSMKSQRNRGHSMSVSQQHVPIAPARSFARAMQQSSGVPLNPETRWRGTSSSAAAMAVPIVPRRRQLPHLSRHSSQVFHANRTASISVLPESMNDVPRTAARSTRRPRTATADDSTASSADSRDASKSQRSTSPPSDSAAQCASTPEARKPSRPPSAGSRTEETHLQMFDRILRHELERIEMAERDELGAVIECDPDEPECSELPGIREAAAMFARAQAACDFDAAVRAAEAAASAAPPEKAEEAAVCSVREYRTEIVDEFSDVVPGDRLVEVVGYVGVTRPVG